jgi:cytochrome c oxidase subunit 2
MRSTAHVLPRAQFNRWLGRLRSGRQAPTGGGRAATTDPKAIFASAGCKNCHTLAQAGATGTVGPNLDKGLKGKTAAFIRQSILDPNAVITPGFSPNVMPGNFRQTLPKAQLDALVSYLAKVTK